VTGGSYTPEDPLILTGSIDVTLKPGTPFVLPLFAWVLERYEGYPAVPDDSRLDEGQFKVTAEVNLDGKPIVTNFWDYYVEGQIDPPAFYAETSSYGSVAAIYFQGVTIVVAPLTPGTHTLTLNETYVIDAFCPGWPCFGIIYQNTWNITVKQ